MHKSRLGAIVIDSKDQDPMEAASFWSKALGHEIRPSNDPIYADLVTPDDQPNIILQKVSHESRVHLDIETDDIEAEVTRLEALGATRIGHVKGWCVMQAPTGQKFCVIRKRRPDFDDRATLHQDP